jgi:HSP20 family molecular chaperone IbpA
MKTDVKETDKGYELAIDMPGYDKKDINLSLDNGYLRVEANKQEREEDEKAFVRRERSYSCARTYYVGNAITEDDIKAKYNNGTLELFVPKKEKQIPEKRNIAID